MMNKTLIVLKTNRINKFKLKNAKVYCFCVLAFRKKKIDDIV